MNNMLDPRPAVFIDRDGTLVEEVNFLSRVEDLELFEYTDEAIRCLKEAGFLVIVITNQSGIGREIFDEADMNAIHRQIQAELSVPLDGFYFCPHLPDENCTCRKPGLGMIEAAQDDFDIHLESSWMIGDKKIDIETGFNAGIGTALVLTGYGRTVVDSLERKPDIIAGDLLEAVKSICERTEPRLALPANER